MITFTYYEEPVEDDYGRTVLKDIEYEPDWREVQEVLANYLVDELHVELDKSEREKAVKFFCDIISDYDLLEQMVEQHYDWLKDYFEDKALDGWR